VQHLSVVEERQRIGMDLHDGIIQSIYAVGLTIENADAQIADGELGPARTQLRHALDALNATTRDIRTYILDLRPRRFQGDNLVVGLERLLDEFKANTLLQVSLVAEPGADRALTPEARLALFHIAQEALSNAAKHSRASRVDVRLVRETDNSVLSVSDNGRGMAASRSERLPGHGLANMQDRARAIGGEFNVGPAEGGGTELRVSVPIASPASSAA
jgi:signal transduction histidine kinase